MAQNLALSFTSNKRRSLSHRVKILLGNFVNKIYKSHPIFAWMAFVYVLDFLYQRIFVDYRRFSDVYERFFVDYRRNSNLYERIRVDYQRNSQKLLNHPLI